MLTVTKITFKSEFDAKLAMLCSPYVCAFAFHNWQKNVLFQKLVIISVISSQMYSVSVSATYLKAHYFIIFRHLEVFFKRSVLKACNFVEKETLAQVFSCDFCEIFKNTYFIKHLWTISLAYFTYDFST